MSDHPYPELADLLREAAAIGSLDEAGLEAKRIALLGRKQGRLTELFRRLPDRPADERRAYGAALNEVKTAVERAFEEREAALRGAKAASGPIVDLSMPARHRWAGAWHPVTTVTAEICDIFKSLGFSVATGPEAEDEWLNFFALNFPKDHPALDAHDTMYLSDGPVGEGGRTLLRTHTSPVQIRVMAAGPPPYRVVIPGMVYRNDPFDASHAPGFVQIEGLAVDEGIGLVDLKATLTQFVHRFFGSSTKVRLRPSYFPFTEPSGELDVQCQVCGGSGCPACKGTGWMEILGCGVVHPNVLANAGVDAERYSGWAFGMGTARAAMNRYGVPDIRLLYGGDMRALRQFAGGGR